MKTLLRAGLTTKEHLLMSPFYSAGDETGTQWMNGAAISFVYPFIKLSVSLGCVRARPLSLFN